MAMILEGNGSNHNAFLTALSNGNIEEKCNRSSEGSGSPPLQGRLQASCEDTASKTIDFLRARLLAERATSKAAKDCAEQNAKRLLELERTLEIEVEHKKKAEAAMLEVMAKLRIGGHSLGSSNPGLDQTRMEKQITTEDKVQVDDVRSPNSNCIVGIAAAEVENPVLNANSLQQDENSAPNSSQSEFLEPRNEGSNDFNSDSATVEDHCQNTSSIREEDQLSNQNKADNDNNDLSNIFPLHQEENLPSVDHGKSLMQDNESEKEDNACQDSPASENRIDGIATMNPRISLEENLRELCNQMGKGVATLENQSQKEFVRLRLHELVDQIVGTDDEQLHKCEATSLQVSSHCSELSVLGCTYVQQNIDGNNSRDSKLQMGLPDERPHIIGDVEADKSFDSNTEGDCGQHNERAAAASIDSLVSRRHENENQDGRHSSTGEKLYSLQSSDCSDTFLGGKEEPSRGAFLEGGKHASFVQKQMPNVQSCLGNSKTDVQSNLQYRAMPEACCDDCFKELHLKMRCVSCKTASCSKSYCNHEKTIQVKRSCSHNQAAISMELGNSRDLSRPSRSDGFMLSHCSSPDTNYLIQNPDGRFYQRRDIVPGRCFCPEGRPAPVSSSQDCLALQCRESSSYMSNNSRNTRNTNVYSEHHFAPLISMQWGSRGSSLDAEAFLSSQIGKIGDVLSALRHAKEQIQISIDRTHHSNAYRGLTLPSHNGRYPGLQLVSRQDATNAMGTSQLR